MSDDLPYPADLYPNGCPCWECQMQQLNQSPLGWFQRMSLCPHCGNKRCPGAADHKQTCSGSNIPGQKGSLYA